MANQPPSTAPEPWPPKHDTSDGIHTGFTPIPQTFPSLPTIPELSTAQKVYNERAQGFQRRSLKGFTTQELVDLDVITSARLKPSTLSNRPLHPIFQSNRWERAPCSNHPRRHLYPLPNHPGLSGDWIFENDLVKNAILPALRIASCVMESAYMLPWFAALLDFKRMTFVPSNRIHPDDTREERNLKSLRNFKSTGNPMTPDAIKNARIRLDIYVGYLIKLGSYQLGFCKLSEDPWTGVPHTDTNGITFQDRRDKIFSFVALELAMPLLRPDLTDSERMGCEWNLANTIIHELCHALWMTVMMRESLSFAPEPYFEDETISELGYAMECAVFGGVGSRMTRGFKQCPIGYWLHLDTCNVHYAIRTNEPVLTSPTLKDYSRCFPIKSEFFENIQQADFWEACIALYGWSALHARNLTEGVRINYSGLKPENRVGDVDELEYERIYEQDLRVNKFRLALHEYVKRHGLELNAVARRNVQVGRAIIRNSIFEEGFWECTAETSLFLEEVVKTLKQMTSGETLKERREALNEIIEFLRNAELQHLKVITAFQLLPPNLQRRERWHDLLNWNRAARIYAKHSFDLAFEDPDFMSTAELYQRREALEYCRMLLFAPFDTTTVRGYQEQALIETVNTQLRSSQVNPCHSTLADLAKLDCGSLFVEAVEMILGSELIYTKINAARQRLSGKVLTDTYNDTARAVEILMRLRNIREERSESSNIQQWIGELYAWIRRANEYLDLCRAAAEAEALPVVL